MAQNDINLELTAAELAEMDAALDTLERLLARLPLLSSADKATHVKPPEGSGDWVKGILRLAGQNLGKLPRDYDPSETERDIKLDADLAPREVRLQRILNRVEGARFLAGSDTFSATLGLRRQLKEAGVAGVDSNLNEGLSRFFSRTRKAEKPASGTGTP